MSAVTRSSFLPGALLLSAGVVLVGRERRRLPTAQVAAARRRQRRRSGARSRSRHRASPRPDNGRGATLSARYHVRQMENVLERAVQHAADMMRRRLQAVTPDVLALAGTPRAQGYRIDGYGLFFSVEVPRLSESVNWALRVLSQDRDERVLASLQKVYSSEQDPVVRADLERAIRTVQLQLSLAPRAPAAAQRRAAVSAPVSRPSTGVAADGRRSVPAPSRRRRRRQARRLCRPIRLPRPPPKRQPRPCSTRASPTRTKSSRRSSDAMLDYAGSLQLPAAEWVTVAARDAGYMAFPDTVSDMVTVTLERARVRPRGFPCATADARRRPARASS